MEPVFIFTILAVAGCSFNIVSEIYLLTSIPPTQIFRHPVGPGGIFYPVAVHVYDGILSGCYKNIKLTGGESGIPLS